jgi:hypothetical protein
MQVVVKKSVLFKALKNILNENRTGHSFYSDGSFLGRFDDKEDEDKFVNSDVPLRPNPEMSAQLHSTNFDVSNPDFKPASKSSFLSAASAVLEHVPEGQIEKVYEKLHSLLDEAHEEEDKRNYGSLQEMLNYLVESSGSREDELFQIAAAKYAKGEPIASFISQIENLDTGMTKSDIEDKISDLGMEIMMNSQTQTKTDIVKPDNVGVPAKRRRTVVRRNGKQSVVRRAKEKPLETVPSETLEDDLFGDTKSAYFAASNQNVFLQGYNDGADAGMNQEEVKYKSEDNDYVAGYEFGYEEFATDDKRVSLDNTSDDFRKEEIETRAAQRNKFPDNIPHVLRMIPEFYMLTQDMGYKLEKDRYNLMMAGDPIKAADKNIRQVFGIGHLETFIIHNLRKSFFTKDYAIRSAKKHLSVIMDKRYNTREARSFRQGLIDAIQKDGTSETEAHELLIKIFVDKMLEDVANLDYEPDAQKKLVELLRSNFAQTTVYKTGRMTGAKGGSEKETAKPYQGNTSATFYRRVKEEYREDIIIDFLARLDSKFLRNGEYKIPSGRKDPNNSKRNEYYSIDQEEFLQKAEEYANGLIDQALQDQRDAAAGKVITPEDEVDDSDITGDEDSPDSMSDEDIAEKLSTTKDFQTLAPFFGFSGAPGMRQWFLKFAKRFFEMGIISIKSGDRTLVKFHSEMVEAVLETLSEKLPDLANSIASNASDDSTIEISSVLLRSAQQIQDAYQDFLDVGDNLQSISVEGKLNNGESGTIPFLDSLGGQLTRVVNGFFFKKVLTKLDKAWQDYVAKELQENESFKNYISDSIASSAKIDAKAARSVAEYFIGKKNAPQILQAKTPGGPRIYRSEAEGNPTKGVKALLKYGIDANAYHIINQEAQYYFEDMLMTDFAKVVDWEGQYRQMIMKDYDKLKKNDKEFKKVILKALDDVITGSSQRMAFEALSDYEVEK